MSALRTWRFGSGALTGAFVAFFVVVGLSTFAGFRSFTVLSGSMEPAISTGDVVVNERVGPLETRPGDVLTFRDPTRQGRLITHRLRRSGSWTGWPR